MICTCCGTYIDVNRNHVWRLELRDVEPGAETGYLMLAAAVCQPCAMRIVDGIKFDKIKSTYIIGGEKNDRMPEV